MEESHQQISPEEKDESVHGKSSDDPGGSGFPDGYSGPRARMVLDSQGDPVFGSISSVSSDTKLGILERVISIFLSFGFLSAVVLSLFIVPIALFGYGTYSSFQRIYSKFFDRKRK